MIFQGFLSDLYLYYLCLLPAAIPDMKQMRLHYGILFGTLTGGLIATTSTQPPFSQVEHLRKSMFLKMPR